MNIGDVVHVQFTGSVIGIEKSVFDSGISVRVEVKDERKTEYITVPEKYIDMMNFEEERFIAPDGTV